MRCGDPLICSLKGSATVLTSFIGTDEWFCHVALQKLHHFNWDVDCFGNVYFVSLAAMLQVS